MNKIVNNFLLAGNFMPKMDLRQPRFTYSTCGQFTRNKERIYKFKEKGNSRYIYQSELDKPCFQHDIAYADYNALPRKTGSNEALRNKAFNLLKIQNMIDIKQFLLQWLKELSIKNFWLCC